VHLPSFRTIAVVTWAVMAVDLVVVTPEETPALHVFDYIAATGFGVVVTAAGVALLVRSPRKVQLGDVSFTP
jgi:hypothetical protein